MEESNIQIIRVSEPSADIPHQVARAALLHKQSIKDGFLSSLNAKVLECLYRSLSEDEGSLLLVARVDGEIAGFLSASKSLRPILLGMVRGHSSALITGLLPEVLRPARLVRLVNLLRYSLLGKKPASTIPTPDLELLSLGVDDRFRRRGIAAALYKALVNLVAERGESAFKIVVGEGLEGARHFYEAMGAIDAGEMVLHSGEKSRIYIHEVR